VAGAGGFPARLLRAWRRTDYRAAGVHVRIGRRSAALDAVLAAWRTPEAGFVGAGNPLGRKLPAGLNHRLQARLLAAARRLPLAAGRGEGRGWAEDHLLIGAAAARLVALARRFRQLGLVLVRRGAPARLVVLRAPRC
jgi:hypothetical protein